MLLPFEQVMRELGVGEEMNKQGLPPGFRFHPTDEELITFYLASKVFNCSGLCGWDIAEVDLNKCEPWELPEITKMGERDWCFFSLRDRKYPTGLRTNRATTAGYWKATGKDKEVNAAATGELVGMKKTLVFYKGRAPRGVKTKWVMHEYRLLGSFSSRRTCKEEWVICRVFHKAGEKKNGGATQGQPFLNFHLEAASSSLITLPPLLETPAPLSDSQSHSPFAAHANNFHNHDFKTLINPLISNPTLFFSPNVEFPQSSFPTKTGANTSNSNPSTSMLPRSFLSYQDQHTVSKPCKTEATFASLQLPDETSTTNMSWTDKIHPSNLPYNQNPLCFETGCGFSRLSSHEVSSSHMMLDFPISLPAGEPWPSIQ